MFCLETLSLCLLVNIEFSGFVSREKNTYLFDSTARYHLESYPELNFEQESRCTRSIVEKTLILIDHHFLILE